MTYCALMSNCQSSYPMFLDGHVGEMHKHVVKLTDTCSILHSAKPTEPQPIPMIFNTTKMALLCIQCTVGPRGGPINTVFDCMYIHVCLERSV